MPVADALRSQLAWSSKKASKSPNTASSHSGGVLTRRSSMRAAVILVLGRSASFDRVAGYSGTPVPKKLGIKPGSRLALASAPPDFARTLGELPDGVKVVALGRAKGPFD